MKKSRLLILGILMLSIGFAAINTTLVITGVIQIGIKQDDFDVYFTEATLTFNNKEAGTVNISSDKKTITFASETLVNLDDTTVLDYKVKNNSTQYDADVNISCEYDKNDYLKITSELNGVKSPSSTQVKMNEEVSGKVTVKLTGNATDSTNIGIECTIVATPIENSNVPEVPPTAEDNPEKAILLSVDENNNGQADVGDKITIGTENFYVISNDGTNVKALAEWNLEVGTSEKVDESIATVPTMETNKQSSLTRGNRDDGVRYANINFASEMYWESINDDIIVLNNSVNYIYPYLTKYKEILENAGANIANVTLATKEEIASLGCDITSDSCEKAPSWVYQTNYWTRSASMTDEEDDPDSTLWVWAVDSESRSISMIYYDYPLYGVRPVITFLVDDLQVD